MNIQKEQSKKKKRSCISYEEGGTCRICDRITQQETTKGASRKKEKRKRRIYIFNFILFKLEKGVTFEEPYAENRVGADVKAEILERYS